MEKYIIQLLEDILAAHQVEKAREDKSSAGIEAHFEDVEKYLSGDYEQKLGNLVDMFKEQFPPAEKLTQRQMKRVSVALEKMFWSYSIYTDLPEKLPIDIAYPLLVSVLDREVYIGEGDGMIGLEFCSYVRTECPFGEKFCSCKDFNGMESFEKTNDESPF